MLTVFLNALLTNARDALLHGDQARRNAVAEQINEVLTTYAQTVLSKRHNGARGRIASIHYKVAATGQATITVLGARAAHTELQRVLAALGAPRRAPSLASLQVALSRAGQWTATVDTDNGAVEISVIKC
jgi:hypothetical protein